MSKKKNLCIIGLLLLLAAAFLYLHMVSDKKEICRAELTFSATGGTVRESRIWADETTAPNSAFARSPYLSLEAGNYTANIIYRSDTDVPVLIWLNGEDYVQAVLPAGLDSYEVPFSLPAPADRVYLEFYYNGVGSAGLTAMELSSDKLLYMDVPYFAALLLLGALALLFAWRRGLFSQMSREQALIAVLLLGTLLLSSLPLFQETVIYGHDVRGHAMRIEGLKSAIEAGHFPAIIYPGTFLGYGSIGVLYPDATILLPALLRVFGVSMVTAYQSLLFGINALTVFGAYFLVRSIGRSRYAGALCAVLLGLAPYRLNALYMRAAIMEALSMAFLLFILAGIYHVFFGEKRKWYLLAIGCSGVLHSHVISTMFAGIVMVCLGFAFIRRLSEKSRLLALLQAAGVTFVINLWYLVPFAYYYLHMEESNAQGVGIDSFAAGAVPLRALFETTVNTMNEYWEPMPTTVGLIGAAVVLIALLALFLQKREGERMDTFPGCVFAFGLICLTLSTNLVPWEQLEQVGPIGMVVDRIQFPVRFLSLSTVCLSMACPLLLTRCGQLYGYRRGILCGALILSVLGAYEFLDVYGAGKPVFYKTTGNYLSMGPMDYTPAGTVRASWESREPIVSDAALVREVSFARQGTEMVLAFVCEAEGQYIDLPVFYYRGYRAVDGNGAELLIGPGEEGRIRVYVPVTAGGGQVVVRFAGFWFITAAGWVSLLFALGLSAYLIVRKNQFKLGKNQ